MKITVGSGAAKPGDFGATVVNDELHVPQEVMLILIKTNTRDAEEFVSQVQVFPSSFREPLGWSEHQLKQAYEKLCTLLCGHVDEQILYPGPPPRRFALGVRADGWMPGLGTEKMAVLRNSRLPELIAPGDFCAEIFDRKLLMPLTIVSVFTGRRIKTVQDLCIHLGEEPERLMTLGWSKRDIDRGIHLLCKMLSEYFQNDPFIQSHAKDDSVN